MQRRWIAVIIAALLVGACAAPGPQMGYHDYLPNTDEDPSWAANTTKH